MTQNRRIKKVKYDGAKVIIHYQVERENESIDEYTLSCVDAPTTEFKQALDKLKTLIADWADMLAKIIEFFVKTEKDDGR